jgi:small subunit ribosomal protein S18
MIRGRAESERKPPVAGPPSEEGRDRGAWIGERGLASPKDTGYVTGVFRVLPARVRTGAILIMASRNMGRTRRRLQDYFLQNKDQPIDYRNAEVLRRFLSPEGKILPARRTGLTAVNQRKVTKAIKRARAIGLLPFTNHDA